jgi:hypothetical protein
VTPGTYVRGSVDVRALNTHNGQPSRSVADQTDQVGVIPPRVWARGTRSTYYSTRFSRRAAGRPQQLGNQLLRGDLKPPSHVFGIPVALLAILWFGSMAMFGIWKSSFHLYVLLSLLARRDRDGSIPDLSGDTLHPRDLHLLHPSPRARPADGYSIVKITLREY